MNSCVPKVFGSMTPPQFGLSVARRCAAGRCPCASGTRRRNSRPASARSAPSAPSAPRRRRCGCRACWGWASPDRPRRPRRCPCPRCSANWPKMLRSIFAPVLRRVDASPAIGRPCGRRGPCATAEQEAERRGPTADDEAGLQHGRLAAARPATDRHVGTPGSSRGAPRLDAQGHEAARRRTRTCRADRRGSVCAFSTLRQQ